jgi:hypothetical protein
MQVSCCPPCRRMLVAEKKRYVRPRIERREKLAKVTADIAISGRN